MIVQTVGSTVGINQLSKPTPTPLPNPDLKLIISSPEPSSIPMPTSKPLPITTNEQRVNNNPASSDGSRTGRIISYHEYCSNKDISVYQNELLAKVSPHDGKTYTMTQGDWDCYDKNSVAAKTSPNNTNNNSNLVTCIGAGGKVYTLPPEYCEEVTQRRLMLEQVQKSTQQTIDNMNKIVEDAKTSNQLLTKEPYKPSQEFLDALEKSEEYNSKPLPTPYVLPTPEPQVYGGCFGNCVDTFTLEYKLNH